MSSRIKRVKKLWQSAFKSLSKLTGFTILDLDFCLNSLCRDLNRVPLDPNISSICPADFLIGYKSLPVNIAIQGRSQSEAVMRKIRESYDALAQFYQDTRLLSPYLWQAKKHGRLCKAIRINDIVYINKLNRLGQVIKIGENQPRLMFEDTSNNTHQDWFPKSELTLILGGTTLDQGTIPKAMDDEMQRTGPQKELSE